MNTPNDGGPAFPNPSTTLSGLIPGMSLRDYFAAAALQGNRAARVKLPDTNHPLSAEQMASIAYQDADAMIAERNKTA